MTGPAPNAGPLSPLKAKLRKATDGEEEFCIKMKQIPREQNAPYSSDPIHLVAFAFDRAINFKEV